MPCRRVVIDIAEAGKYCIGDSGDRKTCLRVLFLVRAGISVARVGETFSERAQPSK